MRLFEFADAKASLELWKLVSDSVWKAISVQAQEQERRELEQALQQKKKPKAAPKAKLPPKQTIARPQPSKAKKTSAQEIQSQKVQSKTLRSKPQTVSSPSSTETAVTAKKSVKSIF
jgi:FtsZ-interacting cell division protein YlmF